MQTNKTTNVILGIIALALIAIIILLVINKSTQSAIVPNNDSVSTNTQVPPLNNYNQTTTPPVAQNTPVQTAPQTNSTATPSATVYPITPVSYQSGTPLGTAVANAQTIPANFDGHYQIIESRCGNGCQTVNLYDKNTDTVYAFPAIILVNDQDSPQVTNYSVFGNTLMITKTNSAGVNYTETWELTSTGFVKIQ